MYIFVLKNWIWNTVLIYTVFQPYSFTYIHLTIKGNNSAFSKRLSARTVRSCMHAHAYQPCTTFTFTNTMTITITIKLPRHLLHLDQLNNPTRSPSPGQTPTQTNNPTQSPSQTSNPTPGSIGAIASDSIIGL